MVTILLGFESSTTEFPVSQARVRGLDKACSCRRGQTASAVPFCFSCNLSDAPDHLNTADGGFSRRIRSRIARNSQQGTATSVIWNTTYRAPDFSLTRRTAADDLYSEDRERGR